MSDFYNKYPYTDFHELNLDWVIERVKKLTEDWLATQQEWNDTEEQWQQLHDYVIDYFANLDVSQEINDKINAMVADGTFLNVIRSTVIAQTTTATENWLAIHITQPTTPVVDTSLTIAGAAADAKVTGDKFKEADARFGDNFTNAVDLTTTTTSGALMRRNGVIDYGATWKYDVTNVVPFSQLLITGTTELAAPLYIFKDSSNNILSVFPESEVSAQYYSDYPVIVPENAATVTVNNYSIRNTFIKQRDVISLRSNIDLLNSVIDKDYTPVDITSFATTGFFDYNTGAIVAYSGYYNTMLNVASGEEYMVTGYPWLAAKLAIVTDSSNNVLASYPITETSSRIFDVEKFKIPENGTRLYLNYNYAGGANREFFVSAYKKTGYKPTVGKTVKLGIIGDSLSAGYMVAGIRYLNLLEAHDKYEVQNFARSGVGYKRDDDHLYSFTNQALRLPSDIEMVLCFGSFNDMPYISDLGQPTDTTNTTICGCINIFIDTVYTINKGAIIGIITPTPWQQYHAGITNSDAYVQAIIDVCKLRNIAYLDLYHTSELKPWDASFRSTYYYNADGTHPNNAGHQLFIYPQVKAFANSLANRI